MCHLEVMRSATPHTGVEPSVGAQNVQTVVTGFPRVEVELECLLELGGARTRSGGAAGG